jgi:hypothetical protein
MIQQPLTEAGHTDFDHSLVAVELRASKPADWYTLQSPETYRARLASVTVARARAFQSTSGRWSAIDSRRRSRD